MSNQNDKFVTAISEVETMEFFSEGLKQAASAAQQLALAQNNAIWVRIALTCMNIRIAGLKLANAKAMGRQATLQMLDRYEEATSDKLEESRPKKFLIN